MLSNCCVQSSAQLITATFSDVKREWAELLWALFSCYFLFHKNCDFGEDTYREEGTDILHACLVAELCLGEVPHFERNLQ